MQSLQQQLLRKPEGNETFLAYQAGHQGVYGSNNFSSPSPMQLPQQSRKIIDLAQRGSSQEAQIRGQGMEQQMLHPVHQAYLQYALQAAQQKSALAMQSQQQNKMGMLGPSTAKDQEMCMGSMKMQELIPLQAVNPAQCSNPRNSSEQFARGEKQIEQGEQLATDHKSEGKSLTQGPAIEHLMPGNMIRPVQASSIPQGFQNVVNNQIAASAQLQAMQAWALERNVDLSNPANANLMAQLIPMMQSRMVSQQRPNESNIVSQSSPAPVSKQQVTSPVVASESPAHASSSSDMSGQSGSAKARQTVPPSHFGPQTNAVTASSTGEMAVQHFSIHGRESQAPLRQPVVVGNVLPPTHPQRSSANMNLLADHPLNAKKLQPGPDSQQIQHIRQLNQSSPQAAGPKNEGVSGTQVKSQGAPTQMPQQQPAFTKQQLHVLKAQILAFRRLKVKSMLPFHYVCI